MSREQIQQHQIEAIREIYIYTTAELLHDVGRQESGTVALAALCALYFYGFEFPDQYLKKAFKARDKINTGSTPREAISAVGMLKEMRNRGFKL